MASSVERMTKRLVMMVKPSEYDEIVTRAKQAHLKTSDYVRKSALGDLPSIFAPLADELAASAARAHKAIDASLASIRASEARIDQLEAQAEHQRARASAS